MIFQTLAQLEAERQPVALCIVVRTRGSTPRHAASKMLVYPDGRSLGTVGGGEVENRVVGEALASLEDGKSRFVAYNMTDPARGDPGVCGGCVEVFVEPILPKPTIVVVGIGHVGKAVAQLAKWMGFRVAVSDDRLELCTPAVIPDVDEYLPCLIAELPNQMTITPWHFFVLTTRGSDVDVAGLPVLLETSTAYIGLMGSKRRWAITRQGLLDAGVTDAQLKRIKSPVGLNIHAETPEEIAVSILAEIIALRANT